MTQTSSLPLSLKDRVGETASGYRESADAERIRRFCEAVGAPISEVAPPTFMTVFRKGEFDLFSKLGIPLARVLHAEQEYVYRGVIRAGDEVTYETRLTHVLEKNGASGSMHFLTFETEVATASGPAGLSKTTIVVRS